MNQHYQPSPPLPPPRPPRPPKKAPPSIRALPVNKPKHHLNSSNLDINSVHVNKNKVNKQIEKLQEITEHYKRTFITGIPFICHYRWFSSQPQLIWTSDDLKNLFWGKEKNIKTASSILAHNIIRVEEAKPKNFPDNIDLQLCFSVLLPNGKSLHLENIKLENKVTFMSAFEWLANHQTISVPYNFSHRTHVDVEYKWTTNLDDFSLIEKIGEGHFGKVFRGIHKDTQIEMAVKTIHVTDEKEIYEIANEVDILKACRHPNIVSYFGWTGPDNDGNVWILMDLCSLGSVMDIKKRNNYEFTEEQLASIIYQAVQGLNYLHSQDIIHQDIKGRNILIKDLYNVTLADFGLSTRRLPASQNSNHKWAPCGTPYFMAPEVISGRFQNTRSDIWSLGMTAIELAEGRPPFHGMKLPQLGRAIVEGEPTNLRDKIKWSGDFRHFIRMCLTKEAELRPSASELLDHSFFNFVKFSKKPLVSTDAPSFTQIFSRLFEKK